jgi:hypothetical protein
MSCRCFPAPAAVRDARMYNRDQWIESFEGQLSILRPHLTGRILATMSLAAWHKHGRKDEDPIKAAKECSQTLGSPTAAPAKRRPG